MKKQNMSKDIVPEGFTLSLVLVDFIPVFLFAITITIFSLKTYINYLVLIGGYICFFSGIIKVLWKLIVVLKKENVWWMFVQMRICMPIGLIILTIGFVIGWKYFSYSIYNASFYFRIFFALWIIRMSLMSLFAMTLDSSDPKANWIEQITNCISQAFLCLGIIFM